MHDPLRTDHGIDSLLSRRRVLASTATLAVGGVGLATLGSDPARAEVTVDSLETPAQTFEADAIEPELQAALAYEYEVDPAASVEMLVFELLVGGDVIDEVALSTSETALSQTTDLAGMVTDASAWQASDFAPAVVESVTREVDVTVTFAVRGPDGDIASDSASGTKAITVTNPENAVARVGGVVTVVDVS